jgi:hypothetical protein
MSDQFIRNTGPCAIPGGHSVSMEELVGTNIKFEGLYNHKSKFSDVASYLQNPRPERYYAWRVYDRNTRGGLKADTSRADSLYNEMRRGFVRPVTVDELKDDHDLPYDGHAMTISSRDTESSTIEAITYRGMMLVELSEDAYHSQYLSRVAKTAQELSGTAYAEAFSQKVRESGITKDDALLFYNDTGEENAKMKPLQ